MKTYLPNELLMSKYIDILLRSRFPQQDLLNPKDFLLYLKKRGFHTSMGELEYYDKQGLVRPVLRLRRPKEQGRYIYPEQDIFSLQGYHNNGLIEFPVHDDYSPWSQYHRESEDIVPLFHPYQIFQIDNIGQSLAVSIDGRDFGQDSNPQEFYDNIKEFVIKRVVQKKKIIDETVIPQIGLCILLDEAYLPDLGNFRSKIAESSFYEEWATWRTGKFQPTRILEQTNFTIEKVKQLYKTFTAFAVGKDPLWKWYILIQIMRPSRRKELKGEALLAQEYYDLAYMLGNFIFDLNGTKMLEPDDLWDGRSGTWKPRIYGEPFDYKTKKTQNNILDKFLIERPFKLGIIVEGDTEEHVINLILDKIHVDNKRSGFFIYNAKGQGNIKENLRGLFHLSNLNEVRLFLILDNDIDADKIKEELKDFVNEDMIHKWKNDFEYDNFGVRPVVDTVNRILSIKGYNPISLSEVEFELSNGKVLMKVIKNIFGRETKKGLEDVISKKHLAEELIGERLKGIEKERNNEEGWKPNLPIEIILNRIFSKIPRWS